MDAQAYKTSFVNEEILILQMGGTIDKDFPRHSSGCTHMEVGEPAAKRILAKVRPFRSILVRVETLVRKSSLELTDADRSSLVEAILNCRNRRILVTHGSDTISKSAARVANTLHRLGIEDKAIVFTGATTPERFRDSDADFNIGVALGFLQNGITGVWVSFGGLVLPWNKAHQQKDGQFVPRRTKSVPVIV